MTGAEHPTFEQANDILTEYATERGFDIPDNFEIGECHCENCLADRKFTIDEMTEAMAQ